MKSRAHQHEHNTILYMYNSPVLVEGRSSRLKIARDLKTEVREFNFVSHEKHDSISLARKNQLVT